jgi:hypothetical protein
MQQLHAGRSVTWLLFFCAIHAHCTLPVLLPHAVRPELSLVGWYSCVLLHTVLYAVHSLVDDHVAQLHMLSCSHNTT